MGIPYTGCGVMASAIGMDKWRTKLLWRGAGLPIPEFVLLNDHSDFAAVEATPGLPLFVKPACEGSSFGVSKVKAAGGLRAAYEAARNSTAWCWPSALSAVVNIPARYWADRRCPASKLNRRASFMTMKPNTSVMIPCIVVHPACRRKLKLKCGAGIDGIQCHGRRRLGTCGLSDG